jgi:hypothetical protein
MSEKDPNAAQSRPYTLHKTSTYPFDPGSDPRTHQSHQSCLKHFRARKVTREDTRHSHGRVEKARSWWKTDAVVRWLRQTEILLS